MGAGEAAGLVANAGTRRAAAPPPRDRQRVEAAGVEQSQKAGAMISLPLLRRLVRGHRIRLAVGLAVVTAWALLFPVIFQAFSGQQVKIPGKPAAFSDFSTLGGTISVGFIHPISIALYGMLSAGLTVGALSGERQRGTLELLLSRPISRRTVLSTMLLEGWIGAALVAAAYVAGTILGSGTVSNADRAAGSACISGSREPSEALSACGHSDAESRGGVRITFGRTTTVDDARRAAAIIAETCARVRSRFAAEVSR